MIKCRTSFKMLLLVPAEGMQILKRLPGNVDLCTEHPMDILSAMGCGTQAMCISWTERPQRASWVPLLSFCKLGGTGCHDGMARVQHLKELVMAPTFQEMHTMVHLDRFSVEGQLRAKAPC